MLFFCYLLISGCPGSSSLGLSLVEVHGLLVKVASLCRAQVPGTQTSVVATHGLSCSEICGIFLDQGLKPCPLHWQADSYPLYRQGSPNVVDTDTLSFCFRPFYIFQTNQSTNQRLETLNEMT